MTPVIRPIFFFYQRPAAGRHLRRPAVCCTQYAKTKFHLKSVASQMHKGTRHKGTSYGYKAFIKLIPTIQPFYHGSGMIWNWDVYDGYCVFTSCGRAKVMLFYRGYPCFQAETTTKVFVTWFAPVLVFMKLRVLEPRGGQVRIRRKLRKMTKTLCACL